MGLMKYKDLETGNLIEDRALSLEQLKQCYSDIDFRIIAAIFKVTRESIFDACCTSLKECNHPLDNLLSAQQELEKRIAIKKMLNDIYQLQDPTIACQCPVRITNFLTISHMIENESSYYINFLAFLCPSTSKEFLLGLKVCRVVVDISQESAEAYVQRMVNLTREIFNNIRGAIEESLEGRLSTQEITFYEKSKVPSERKKYMKYVNYAWQRICAPVMPESVLHKRKSVAVDEEEVVSNNKVGKGIVF